MNDKKSQAEPASIEDYVHLIQQRIASGEKYEDYVPEIERYKQYLKKQLEAHPFDVDAVCQLATAYCTLNTVCSDCIDLLEHFLTKNGALLSGAEKSRILTNLAFYYENDIDRYKRIHDSYREDVGDAYTAHCLRCLREAVDYAPSLPNAYDALGRWCSEQGKFKEAIRHSAKAAELSTDVKYRYNHAVTLYQSGDIAGAKKIFERLSVTQPNERRIKYGLGACLFYLGDIDSALTIAGSLAAENGDGNTAFATAGNESPSTEDCDDYIGESELAVLFFLCGAFEKHNRMYDEAKMKYFPDESWLYPYFYCLHILGREVATQEKLEVVVKEKEERIVEAMAEPLEEGGWDTEGARTDYIESVQKEKAAIEAAYQKVQQDEKPDIHIKLWHMSGCYLVDCIQHQKI